MGNSKYIKPGQPLAYKDVLTADQIAKAKEAFRKGGIVSSKDLDGRNAKKILSGLPFVQKVGSVPGKPDIHEIVVNNKACQGYLTAFL